ncbi:thioredoxin [Photobacterium sp. BZF1]|uniref:Thioredoxin n=1 Tax=Photobacterium rosenbergii TaxID=294936 RepID=A0A2T3NJ54_9GAMM|nr:MULTISPECIES: thioredoxin family protein [Photobacterium]MBC7004649.1 thioredoxin [Photobacterium sp. BZF1]MBY5944866.1 thioredoxin family protein [Photobacterium rosenbergii]PSW15482.1 thiol reductase thioredoxin [Photobacterium rosenbergii]
MIELTKENFDAEVKTDGIVLVDFWSENCGRCIELMPEVMALAEKYGEEIKFCKLNIQGNRRLAMAQKVMGLPSFVFYRNGEKAEHLSGEELEIEHVESMIESFVAETA